MMNNMMDNMMEVELDTWSADFHERPMKTTLISVQRQLREIPQPGWISGQTQPKNGCSNPEKIANTTLSGQNSGRVFP
jgi:hypothetical protein